MKIRFFNLLESIETSLWFIPTVMVIIASILAFVLIKLNATLPSKLRIFFYTGRSEGARLLLSTIAGSLITIAGVSFSITIVALTLAIDNKVK